MKVQDFEKAIGSLEIIGLEITEMKMAATGDGNVSQVNGHTKTLTVVWDVFGRAFTAPLEHESEEFIELDSGKAVRGRRLTREPKFDLKFE